MRGTEIDTDLLGGADPTEGRGIAGRGSTTTSWVWEYPELEVKVKPFDERKGGGRASKRLQRGIRLCRAALYTHTNVPILLLDGLEPANLPPHVARSSDGYRSSSINRSPVSEPPERSALEVALWETLGDSQPLEGTISEIAYDLWLNTLGALPREGDSVEVLWALVRAIENNADVAKRVERRSQAFANAGVNASGDWIALTERLHRRMQLSAALSVRSWQKQQSEESHSNSSRILDRIAYLGGLLLPLTVVSGVLSIEGEYGPGGSAFWVFWLASALCSVFTILIIYADHLRTLDVWIEIAASEVLDGLEPSGGCHTLHHHNKHAHHSSGSGRSNAGFQGIGDPERGEAAMMMATTTTAAPDGSVYVVQRRTDGTGGRAWRKGELGWMGAMKKMSGWYRWRGSTGMEFQMPASFWRGGPY
ncbi:hypothetical protein BGZ63DRAFT_494478 [Mariannaea sp. PMI_226]|nr:hypothetical protein BGZ63DRAFT_494478 [Mariannaea sp. PMI_226]